MHASTLLFDRFELRPAQRRLLRDGEPVTLRTRAFDLLLVLVERAGTVVTKSELLDLVWSGVIVEENNIAAQIVALRKVIGGDLIATVPGRGYSFTGDVRTADSTPASSAAPASPAPPSPAAIPRAQPQHLFGREDDLARIERALTASGCVTLVGPGGVGKTVLARAAAARWAGDRTAWVDLAALSDGADLDGALCRALGISTTASPADSQAALTATLGKGFWLLVLDNAEHVVEAVAVLVATLLGMAPSLAILVTSQLPLRVAGERVEPLEPLALPSQELSDVAAFDTAAVQMLVERVRTADPRFQLGPDSGPLLRKLCARLDGLPLALEMAGAVAPLLGLQGVLTALDHRFDTLRRGHRDAPPRQRTLRAAMEWSYALLEPLQQRMFQKLSVFASDFSLEVAISAASEAGQDRWDTTELLAELVDRSLVASLHVDPPRYRLLETMRSFGLEQLGRGDDDHAARRAASRAIVGVLESDQAGHASPMLADLANVPELLNWARRHDPDVAIALTLAASKVATWTPWIGAAARWIEAGEALLGHAIAPAVQAEWWRELARYQSFVRGPRTSEAARKACDIERQRGDALGLFWSLVPLLRSRVLSADEFESVRSEAQALLDAHPEWPDRTRIVFSGSLALEYRRHGDFQSAWVHQQAEADLAERAGLSQIADNAQTNLSATLIGMGRYDEALARLSIVMERSGHVESPVTAHNHVQRLNALVGLARLDEAQALAPQALDWCSRYDVLDVFQVLALLAAAQGRPHVAVVFVANFRQRLAERGAELPQDAHALWREALRLISERIDAAELDRLLTKPTRLDPPTAVHLLLHGVD